MTRLLQFVSSLRRHARIGDRAGRQGCGTALPFRRSLVAEAIEQRVLLAADPAAVVLDAVVPASPTPAVVQNDSALLSAAALTAIGPVTGVTYSCEWVGAATGGDWNTAANWSTGLVPTATDTVHIGLPATATVSIASGAAQAAALDCSANLSLSGGSLDLSGDGSIAGVFTQTGGTLTGAGTLVLTNATNTWTGGSQTGGGTTRIAAGALLAIGGQYYSLVGLGDRTLRNEGTIVDQGSNYYGVAVDLNGAAVLDLAGGTLQFTHGNGWVDYGNNSGSADSLRIQGSGSVTGASLVATNTDLTIAADAVVAGSLGVRSSTAHVLGAVTLAGWLADASSVQFDGSINDSGAFGNINSTQTITGALTVGGDFNLAGGTLTLAQGADVAGNFTESDGTLVDGGVLTWHGAQNTWTNGAITGGGTARLVAGSTLTIGGQYFSLVGLGDLTLRNEGTIVDKGSNYYGVAVDLNGAVVLDNAGGSLQFTHNYGWSDYGNYSGSADSLRIQGSASGSGGTFYVGNTDLTLAADMLYSGAFGLRSTSAHALGALTLGALAAESSTLAVDGSAAIVGALSVTSSTLNFAAALTVGGTLGFAGGSLTLAQGADVAGNFTESDGTLVDNGVLTWRGTDNTWTNGAITGGGTARLVAGSTLTIGGQYFSLVGLGDLTLRNEGTIVDKGSNYYGVAVDLNGAVVLDNAGGSLQFTHNYGWSDYGNYSGSADSLRIQGSASGSGGTFYVGNTDLTLAADMLYSGAFGLRSTSAHALGALTLGGLAVESSSLTVDGAAGISGALSISGSTVNFADALTIGSALSFAGGSLTLAQGADVGGNFTMTAGTLSDAGLLTWHGADNTWTGGTITGGGTAWLTAGALLTIGGQYYSLVGLGDLTLRNAGTIVDKGSSYYGIAVDLNGAVVLDNAGGSISFTHGNGWADYNNYSGSADSLRIQGTAAAGSGNFQVSNTDLTLAAGVVLGNALVIANGSAHALGAATLPALTVSAGNVLFDGPTTINGALVLNNGNLEFAQATDVSGDFTFGNGRLGGAGSLNLWGLNNAWLGGAMTGGGTTRITTAAALTIGGQYYSQVAVGDRRLRIEGSITDNGSPYYGNAVDLDGAAVLDFAGGTLALTHNNGWRDRNNGSGNADSLTIQGSGRVTGGILYANETDVTLAAGLTLEGGLGLYGGSLTAAGALTLGSLTIAGGTAQLDGINQFSAGLTLGGGALTVLDATTVGGDLALSAGTLTLPAATDVAGNLLFSGGTLTGTGTLSLAGAASTWNNGTMTGGGTTRIRAGATLTLGGIAYYAQVSLGNRTIRNEGTIIDRGSSYYSQVVDIDGAVVLDNAGGTLEFTHGYGWTDRNNNSGSADSLLIEGTGSIASGTFVLANTDITLDAGTVLTGALVLSNGSLSAPGPVTLGGLTVNGGTASFNGATRFENDLSLNAGTLTLSGATDVTGNLLFSGGTLTGAGTLSLAGAANTWNNGTMTGGGTTRILAGATLTLGGNTYYAQVSLGNRTIRNEGTLIDRGSSYYSQVVDIDGAVVLDNAGGTLEFTHGYGWTDRNNNSGSADSLLIEGTGTITAGRLVLSNTDTTFADGTVLAGAVTLSSGNLTAPGSVTLGTLTVSDGSATFSGPTAINGDLALNGGSLTVDGSADVSGSLTMPAGTLTGAGSVSVAGAASSWTGGTMTGGGTTRIATGGSLTIGGTTYYAMVYLGDRSLRNDGSIIDAGSPYYVRAVELNGAASLDNQGTLDLRANGGWLDTGTPAGTLQFANAGLLTKSGGGGDFNFQNTAFSNSGDIYIAPGAGRILVNGQALDTALQPRPNLVVNGLQAVGDAAGGGLVSGGVVDVSWRTANIGNVDAGTAFVERLVVTNAGGTVIASADLPYDPATTGVIAAGSDAARTVRIQLPIGTPGSGLLTFSVTTDVGKALLERGPTGELDNITTIIANATLLPYADLQVQGVAVSPAAGLSAGEPVRLRWQDANTGDKATDGPWSDHVVVRNLSTGEVLLDQTVAVAPADAALAPGGLLDRQIDLNWPAGVSGTGRFQISVTTDALGQIVEFNPAGNAEANNGATLAFTNAPDLRPSDLVVLNAAPQAGDVLDLQWTVNNDGNAATPQGWYDRIRIDNLSNGQQLADLEVFYDPLAATGAALGAGQSATRSLRVQLPDGLRAAGDLRITVDTDQRLNGGTAIPESDETNNHVQTTRTVAARTYANLVVGALSSPSVARSGDAVVVSWTIRNAGDAAAVAADPAGWTDRLILSRDAIFGNGDDMVLASLVHGAALAVGDQYSAQVSATIPAGLDGDFQIGLVTDATAQVLEPDTRADNTSAAQAVLLTPYHADLLPSFTAVPDAAVGGTSISVGWQVSNVGDAVTPGTWWTDQLWLTNDGLLGASAILLGSFGHGGALAPGGSYATTQQVVVPNGIAGPWQLVLRTDSGNAIAESRFDGNNTVVSAGSLLVTPAPAVDLRVASVTAPLFAEPGQQLTVAWDIANTGVGIAAAPWTDQVFVSRDGTANGAVYLGSLTHNSPLAAGDTVHNSLAVGLPDLADGEWHLLVVTDVANQVYESGAPDAESANSGAAAATIVVHPDLAPNAIAVTALTGGQAGSVSWTDRNLGSGYATGAWVDRVYLSNDGLLDGGDLLLGEVGATGGLAAGADLARSLDFSVPLAASGNAQILVVSDAANSIREAAGESNNLGAAAVTITPAPLPDLVVGDIQAPATGLPGRPLAVAWTVTNAGDAPAGGDWSEQVWLSDDGQIGGDILLGSFFRPANALAAGASVQRSATVNLPPFAATGAWRIVVRVDSGNAVVEQNEQNNAAIAATTTDLGAALSLTLGSAAVAENAGTAALNGTVVRSGDTGSALTVSLASTLTDITLPPSVTIAAGQSSVSFTIGVVDNTIVDGNRDARISAAAAATAYADASATLRIIDNDLPALVMSAPVTTVDEGYGPLTVTLTRNTDPSAPMTVLLANNKPYKLLAPDSVSFAAGASTTSFQVTPVNDTVAEGDRSVDLAANAAGFSGAALRLRILDNDIPTLTMTLADSVVSEGAGAAATHGTLTRSIVVDSPLTVALTGVSGRVRVPSFVTFAAGQASLDFDVSVLQNSVADGDHLVRIGASVVDQFSGTPLPGTGVQQGLLITDDDGPTLSLTIDRNVVAESAGAGAATATVTRNTALDGDLVVHLSSTDTTEATVPTTVVIPAGQASASFAVDAVQDGIQDGTQNLTLVASAAGFNSGSVGLAVTDRDLADLQVAALDLPATVSTGGTLALSWTTLNAGLGDASGAWQDNVYLSTDAVLSADDQLVGSFAGSTPLAAKASYTRTIDLTIGQRAGDLWAFVVADSGNSVAELSDGNNIRSARITVTPSYSATIQAAVHQVPSGTAVDLSGHAFDVATGAAQKFSIVTVKVATGGVIRSIDALTDKNGDFHARFTPLPGEAGRYTIGVVYPGLTDFAVQDGFDIVGLKATNAINAALTPGQTASGQLLIQNLGPVDLHNVQAALAGLPTGVSVTFAAPATLAAGGTLAIDYTVTAAADAAALSGSATVAITCDESARAGASFGLSVTPLAPQLVANPGFLASGMLRGTQKAISFDVVNTGGAATGPLTVQLPADATWLGLGSAAAIASLAPGEKTTVTLLLTPPADLALQRYDGTINIVGKNSYATVAFQFRAVSEAVGDVHVTVQDEYSFFAADKPNLAGAHVDLVDPYSGQVVASAVTDATGGVDFAGIAEGTYSLQVSADQHDSLRTTVHVTPGTQDQETLFLHRQAVSYNWTVVPTEVKDHYKLVLESTFLTEVPMPVVTVDEPLMMPLVVPGYATTFNVTVRNHGLIDALKVSLQVPNDPDFVITPLIGEIPVLAAKSEVTIPCTIRLSDTAMARLSASGGNVSVAGSGLSTSGGATSLIKCLGLSVIDTYQCIEGRWQSVPVELAAMVACPESLSGIPGSIGKYLESGGAGNLLNAGCDLISAALDCLGSNLTDCETMFLTTACKGLAGGLGGVASNWADILACLCSLGLGATGQPGSGGDPGAWGFGGPPGGPGVPYSVPVGVDTTQMYCTPPTAMASADAPLATQAGNGVCATVRLRIDQQAVITRSAFQGTLELNNGHATSSLTDASMTLDIRDANGNDANGKFVVRGPTTQDVTVDANGHWTVNPSTIGKIFYTFVPTGDAAPDAPTVYTIGGTLHYDDGGTPIDVPLLPARITVYPEAKLNLDYFWQRDIVGDDPFTVPVEPSEPFALGLQVTNVGKGGAGDLTITSAQPKIIENEKGLLVDFKIVSSSVGATPGTNSLTVDLGNIAPGATASAQWNLLSSLQGQFKDFSASFEHLDDNGDLRTSLIQSVTLHELTRAVQVTSPTDDHIPDYLVNDVPDAGNLPDKLYLSTGGQAAVTVAGDAALSGSGTTRTLSATMQSGWSYLTVADPLPGYELVSVVRSDGKVLPVQGMVWRTDRTFHAGVPGATNENLLHLLDLDSTGSYTVTYAIVDHVAPTLDTITGIAAGLHVAAVDSVDLTFSEAIAASTLSAADLHLSFNGAEVTLPDLGIAWVAGNTWRVSGLAGITAADGNYQLSVDAAGITDLAGNAGTHSRSVTWAMGASSAVIVDLTTVSPDLRNTPIGTLDLAFSRDIDPASVDWTDLELSRDGQTVALDGRVSISAIDARTFRIAGLDDFTAGQGHYKLTVHAAGIRDAGGAAGTGQFSRAWTTDTTAPAVLALEPIATNPRNTVIASLDVSFSEAINPASFDWHDITLTRNGGANLITSEVAVAQVDATTWRISGFNWKSGLDGLYLISVDGAGITDLAGNAGTGNVAETWTMDIGDPLAPTHLALVPDTGISGTDGRTNATALTITGDLPEAGLQVRLTDVTNNRELGYATVSGLQFSSAFTITSPGQHRIRVRAVDAAGNTAPDAFVDVFIDTTPPGVSSVAAPSPGTRTTPVDSIDFAFDEAVVAADVTLADLGLTRDGVDVPLDGAVTLAALSGNGWRVSGLAALTAAPGSYALTVSAAGVHDLAGNAGVGAKTASWTTVAELPTAIRGTVYEDLDGSASFNPAHWNPEAGIAGRTVFLDANANGLLDAGEVSTLTATDGSYQFDHLAAGSYRVTQQLPTGWIATTPTAGSFTVALAAGQTVSGADFGDFLTAQIAGFAFNDLNADGTRDAGEAALAGWTVFLDANADGLLNPGELSTVTGADGGYRFDGLLPGTVQVGEIAPDAAAWHRTTPAVPFALKSGQVISADLGNLLFSRIAGLKFNDLNGNGILDPGEPGVQGWTIFLDANTNGQFDPGERSTLTDASGAYAFDQLLPGSYTVAEAQRDGWIQTKPLPGAVTVGVSTAASEINLEADCACGGTWATYTGAAQVDYGKLAIDTALASTGITALRQQPGGALLDGRGTTTVVIDTGIDLSHPFFGLDANGDGVADRIVYQYDFADGDTNASDVNGHGSNVASIIGSQDSLYQGVAPGTDLIALKVFQDSGKGTFAYLEKALQWVLANHDAYHIDVVNLSLGDNGNWTDQFSRYGIGDELAALAQTDVIVIAAAGNNYLQFGRMGVAYPASDPAAIAVGATWAANFGGPWTVAGGATNYATGADEIAAFSQRDTALMDTFAPGARFNGANASGGITTMQGTSQAAAFVSGAAALAQQAAHQVLGRGLTTGEFATLLRNTGDLITDGDDEVDNVVNTGQKFPRLDMVKLIAAISALKDAPAATGGNGGSTGSTQPVSVQAASGVYNLAIAAGANAVGNSFGNFQLARLNGSVFDDANADGVLSSGETGLAGVTVFLDANGNGSLDSGERSTLTDAAGAWAFSAVGPGTAQVRVALPAGMQADSPVQIDQAITSGMDAQGLRFAIRTPQDRLVVTAFAGNASGFSVRFSDTVDASLLNLYGGPADVSVVGASTGAIKGSLVMDADGRGFSFIKTGAPLAADHYQVTIRGSADAVASAQRGALDGNADGQAGGDYGAGFDVAAQPVRLKLPDFARAPGQPVNLAGGGLPVSLVSSGGVTDLSLRLRVDPSLLSVTEIRRGAGLPPDASLVVTAVAGSPGQWDIAIHRDVGLAAGTLALLSLVADVPATAAAMGSGAVVLDAVVINGVQAPMAGDSAVGLLALPGDLNFDGAYTAADATLAGRIGAGLVAGLAPLPRTDAAILADVDNNGVVNALDTAALLARSRVTATALIPALPAPVLISGASLALPAVPGSNGPAGGGTTPTIDLAGTASNFALPVSASVLPAASLRILPTVVSGGVAAA